MRNFILATALVAGSLSSSQAFAAGNISARCQGISMPAGYDEQLQQDYLANYFALALTLSPLHGPIPHEPGHGALGLDLLGMPPLSCARQFVMGHTKTESTNFTPVAPRLRGTFAFPVVGGTHFYAGLAYLPAVSVFGMRNVVAGGEVGAGWKLSDSFDVGARYHFETIKTVGEIATPFVAGGTVYPDYYNASTFGLDAMAGFTMSPAFRPHVAVGQLGRAHV